jgi:prevent-host-death family protein
MEQLLSVYEAKTHFSSYLQRATAGESFTVTSHGKPVARISPPLESIQDELREAQIRAAIERIKARHADPKTPRVSQAEWKEWINEGRKN